jgi:hypothetical protein
MEKTVVSPSWKLEVLTKEISDLLQKSFRKLTAINPNLNSRFKRQWRWTIKWNCWFILVSSRLYFCVLDKSEVVSKSSLMEGAYFNGGSFAIKFKLYAPLVYSYLLFTVHKDGTAKIGTLLTQDSISWVPMLLKENLCHDKRRKLFSLKSYIF